MNQVLSSLNNLVDPADNLLEFTKKTFSKPGKEYQAEWFHHLLAKELEVWERKECEFLFVSMPPGYGKSELISRSLPAWVMGRHPADWIITASHTAQKAEKLSKDVRARIKSDAYQDIFPGMELDSNQKALNFWANNFGGGYMCFGAGAACVGDHGNWIIVDDPVAKDKYLLKPENRENLWQWFVSEISQRIVRADGSPQILLMHTRWHHDDIAGRLLRLVEKMPESQQKKYRFLILPALLNEKTIAFKHPEDPRGTGEPLCLKYHNKDALAVERLKSRKTYYAQYECNPIVPGAGAVKRDWFQVAKIAPVDLQWSMYLRFPSLEPNSADGRVGVCQFAKGPKGEIYFKGILSLEMHHDEAIKFAVGVKPKKLGVAKPSKAKESLVKDIEEKMGSVDIIAPEDPLILSDLGSAGKLILVEENELFLEECDQFIGKGDSEEAMVRAVTGAIAMIRSEKSVLDVIFQKLNHERNN